MKLILVILALLTAGYLFAKETGDTCFVRQDHVYVLVNDACTLVNGKISNCVSARVECDAP